MDFDGRKCFREKNEAAEADYRADLEKVAGVNDRRRGDGPYDTLFHRLSGWLLDIAALEERLSDEYFALTPIEELSRENDMLYRDIEPDNYSSGYLDPAWSVSVLGDGFGQLMSAFYRRFRILSPLAFQHRSYRMAEEVRLFLEVEDLVKLETPPLYDDLRIAATRLDRSDHTQVLTDMFSQIVDPDFGFYRSITERADPSDLRYLYRYGCRISDKVLKTTRFVADAGTGLVNQLAESVVDAYIRSFEADGKPMDTRRTVTITAPAGYEPVTRRIIRILEERDLVPLVRTPIGRPVNRQYATDHLFDYVLYFDEDVSELHSKNRRDVMKRLSAMCDLFSGRIIFFEFGEEPFSPQRKPECLKPDDDLAALWRNYEAEGARVLFKYLPRSETSFTAIAFPAPDIRGDFGQIFADTLEINTLDSEQYEKMQQKIIDVLDTADHVRITGSEQNRTDLRVALHELSDPGSETNFLNCIDTVNIPLGEVFTSPKLKGTEGTLHVEEAFLNGLRFDDLCLTFRDGYVVDYDCRNFDDRDENRKYIHENLLYPHDSLPMGEFAIGSNTHAYAMAKRHGIMDLLPVLIIEKMGPHFAIGDTCFSNEEDHEVRNRLDGKEVIARDNELSILRREDPMKAYTQKHTDITLPYSSLDSISAVLPGGEEIFIIRGGRFTLAGTESLNDPIDQVDGNDPTA